MAYRLPGSLTARITIGFLILVVTFAGVSLSNVRSIESLNQWIRVTHDGYLQLALVTGDLDSKQTSLLSELREVGAEPNSDRSARKRLQTLTVQRQALLDKTEGILGSVGSLIANESTHKAVQKHFANMEALVARMNSLVADTAEHYEGFLRPRREGADAGEMEQAHDRLVRLERQLTETSHELKKKIIDMVLRLSARLDELSSRIWIYTLIFSGLALVFGIAMTIAARLMLRPLQRLGDAARRIARGDYAHRIEVRGPKEIAELAKEFNVMGKAIEVRSSELVRTERLATAGKMAAMITHEVRNPLSSIGLNTELLEEECAALSDERRDEAQGLCRAITTEVDRLTEITEEYLQLARLPTPKLQEESLEAVAQRVVDFSRDQFRSQGVALETDFQETPRLLLDEGQIRQALLNLIRNAAEAAGGQEDARVVVAIRSVREGGTLAGVELEVRDNGPGISDEIRETLFEAFVSSKSSGTGLGLALTHQIIADHGATIEAHNAVEGGAVFCIEFSLDTTKAAS